MSYIYLSTVTPSGRRSWGEPTSGSLALSGLRSPSCYGKKYDGRLRPGLSIADSKKKADSQKMCYIQTTGRTPNTFRHVSHPIRGDISHEQMYHPILRWSSHFLRF